MSLISVEDALAKVLASAEAPVSALAIPIADAAGYTLAEDVRALRDQPPFAASAMDGYAVRFADIVKAPATLKVIGSSAAGCRFAGYVGEGQAVRIFTGAPLPDGADTVVIQENTDASGDHVTVKETPRPQANIRPAGLDFRQDDILLRAGQRLDARHIALAASMGHGTLAVRRKPRVAILATGDELVRPGETVGRDQITASSQPAIAAMVMKAGGEPIDLGIAQDTLESLDERLSGAEAAGADIIVTLGGASVGEHDLVQTALQRRGMDLGFWRVALRPGKPLMHGRLGQTLLLGLPGNPVSSFVCAILFLVPAIRAMSGDPQAGGDPTEPATLATDVAPNRERQDYMRAGLAFSATQALVSPHKVQDSSLLALLHSSDALLVRKPHAPAGKAGEPCRIIRLSQFC